MLVVRALHLVAMAFFVGGQLMLAGVIVPALRDRDREGLLRVARGFGYGSLIALVVLVITGSIMAGHFEDWSRGLLHAKLALVAAVIVMTVVHMRKRSHALEGLIFLASLAIVWLGVDLAH